MKRFHKVVARIIGILVVALLLGAALLCIPRVQGRIVSLVTNALEADIDGTITFDDFKLFPFNNLILTNVVILDANPYTEDEFGRGWQPADTLASIGRLSASFTLKGLTSEDGVELRRLRVEHAAFNLVNEPGGIYDTNLQRVFRIPHKEPKPLPEFTPEIITIHKLIIKDFHFSRRSFKEEKSAYRGVGFCWDDLGITADATIHHFHFGNMIASGDVENLSLSDKRGYVLRHAEGDVTVGRGNTTITGLRIRDDWTDAHLKEFKMDYANSKVFNDFLNKVTLRADFANTTLAMKTISFFTGSMQNNEAVFHISEGVFEGPVSGFRIENTDITETGSGIAFRADASIIGLPDIKNAFLDIKAREASISTAGLTKFIGNFIESDNKPDLSNIAKGITLSGDIFATGTLDSLQTTLNLNSTAGAAGGFLTIRNLLKGETGIDASIDATGLDLGKLAGTEALGAADFSFAGRVSIPADGLRAEVDSLIISKLTALGYPYTGIFAKGGYGKRGPYGYLIVNDPSVKAVLSGERMHYSARISQADLRAMNLDKRGGRSEVSLNIDTEISDRKDKTGAKVILSNINLANDNGDHNLGKVEVRAFRTPEGDVIDLKSSFARAAVRSSGDITNILGDLQKLTLRRELPAIYTTADSASEPADYTISLSLGNMIDVLDFALPSLYVAEGTSFELSAKSGKLASTLKSQRIAYGEQYARDIFVSADNSGEAISLEVRSDQINLSGISFKDARADFVACTDIVGAGLTFDIPGAAGGHSSLNLIGLLTRNDDRKLEVEVHSEDSSIGFGGKQWDVSPTAIRYCEGEFSADNFEISCENQKIRMDGGISVNSEDAFHLGIENLDLSIAELIIGKDYGISGHLGGRAQLLSPVKDNLQLMISVSSDSLKVGGHDAGDIRLGTSWDDTRKRLSMLLQNSVDGRKALDAKAYYNPGDKTIEAVADIDKLRLMIAAPFLRDIFSDIDGAISGKINCSGPLDNIKISSHNAYLDKAMFKVALTGVPYTINGPFALRGSMLEFSDLKVSDGSGGSGTVSGSLTDFLSKPTVNARLSATGLRVLGIDEDDAPLVYGRLAISGEAELKGPLSDIAIDANIHTEGQGNVHVPIGSSVNQSSRELLTFTSIQRRDPYEELLQRRKESAVKTNTNIKAKARVIVSDQVGAFVEIDKSSGNVFSANGSGLVDIDFDLQRSILQLKGDYSISKGIYHFAIPGIVGKDLSVKEGSSIKFGGDLMESQMDIKAIYNTRTSLSTLIADSTSVAARRPVNCELSITDKLSNPQIGFNIEIQDLDPTTQSQVQGALNTEDKIQKQFIALLLFGSFLPSETSGIVNNSTNMLYANATEIMAGQLNNILQKLEIPLDLGFGYQADDGGTDIFDVAVSTQLFNNRVIVGGSVGNRKYSTSHREGGDMVGDLDIEVKLNQSGQLRLKLFSHSADEYTSFLDYSQRNGGGITYQKEYNNLSDLFRKNGSKTPDSDRKKTITITNDERKTVSDSRAARRKRARRGPAGSGD